MFRSLLPLSLCLLFFFGCKSQKPVSETEKSDVPFTQTIPEGPERPPVVLVKMPGDTASRPLRLSELKIDVKVVGNLATTTLDMLFANETDRVLEGQLYFPLGEGQTVSRFALDVNGKLREGVVVEKVKGRQAYEATIRQQIDPGLLEWTAGQNFKARIYPIPAQGYKRMVVAYEQELLHRPDGYQYLLPMHHQEKVDSFTVDVRVFRQEVEPTLEENELNNLVFQKWEESYLAQQRFADYLPNQQLGFLVPQSLQERKVLIEEANGKWWFYLNLKPEAVLREKPQPSQICLLWDVSHSAGNRNLEKELAILDAYFQTFDKLKVDLIPFAVRADKPESFRVQNGDWQDLRARLQALPQDGATQWSSLDLRYVGCDEFLLFSDGLHNFGSSELKVGNKPVIAINSSAVADYGRLRHIAQLSGGQFINALQMETVAVVRQMRFEAYRFLGAEYEDSQITETYPQLSQAVSGSFSLAGQLKSSQASLRLNFGFGQEVITSETITLDLSQNLSTSGLVPRLWAQKKLAELDLNFEENEEAISGLARDFGVVTRNTSLIVLDRIEDYVEYEIVPPPELRTEYDRLLAEKKSEKQIELLSHLDQVAEAYAVRKDWWKKDFKAPAGMFQMPDSTRAERSLDRDADGVVDEMVVQAAAPPAQADEMSMDDAFGAGDEEMGFDDTEAAKSAESTEEEASGGEIRLNVWDPQTPYLEELKKLPAEDIYAGYLKLKPQYLDLPAFFLDVGHYLFRQDRKEEALRVLSNLAELELENHELLRALAYKLEELAAYPEARSVYETVRKIRPEEPQSWRDLALMEAKTGAYQSAVDGLWEVVRTEWPERFPEISVLTAQEMNSLIARSPQKLKLDHIDKRLRDNLDTDVRVVLNWDANEVDMDLWVTDPRGEKCYYAHNRTQVGGWISRDFTGGYGPEEFWLRKAIPGIYQIEVNYYGSRQQRIAGPTNIRVELITDYGRKSEQREEIVMRLGEANEVIAVGELKY
jgi:tetratricopeptide (TPR) repeat protein